MIGMLLSNLPRRKRFLILILLGALVMELVFLAKHSGSQGLQTNLFSFIKGAKHSVVLQKDGFYPKEITINKGDTITFTTTRENPFWPASNLHPTHEIYSEFDPKQPIDPKNSWSFQFNKAGSWNYHDHIHPNFRGKITVVEDGKENKVAGLATSCIDVDVGQKQACWDNLLEATLEKEGFDAAFNMFIELYHTEPDIPKACHGWGHVLGEAGYKLYAEKRDFVIRPEVSYCGYGFYHGFMEKLIQKTGEVNDAPKFCEYVGKQLSDGGGGYGNCVHGVGHGYTAWLIETPKYWGNFQAAADEALKRCEEFFGKSSELRNCYDGVFNELQQDILRNESGLSYATYMEKGDPFFYCRNQEERHKEACYFEFIGLFDLIFNDDIMKATKYVIDEIPNPEHQDSVILKLAADFMQDDLVKENQLRNVEACRIVPPYLFEPCFRGVVNGFIQHGEPGKQHIKALTFCKAGYLSERERELCYQSILGLMKGSAPSEQFSEICSLIDKTHSAQYCNL